MRKKVFFAFVIVNLISILISPVAFGQSSGPYTVFLPKIGSGGPNEDNLIPIVSSDVYHDTSAPLAQLAAAVPKSGVRPGVVYPAKPAIPFPSNAAQGGTAEQLAPDTPIGVTMGLSFPGIGKGDYGYSPDVASSDTTLAVGATQVVQWVNTDFAVFDKTTGAIIFGPIDGYALWNGFGGGCQANNDGDPMVQWDQIAQRWVFAQFSVSTQPYLYCIAVSTTSDATGAFNRYAFSYTNFPDSPEMGIWPDAYYVTFNMLTLGTFSGARDCAFDRAKMLAGLSATQICFQRSTAAASDLPADLDGTTLPPAGAPNYLLDIATSSSLRLTKFHVDFTTPASSTLTSALLPVAAFTTCVGACIVQPGTSNLLELPPSRLMYRLSYRNYGAYEALVVTHTVRSSWITSGIRWYEIRNPGGSPVLFQQSTYAPDAKFRWMGSIAQDKQGNLAVGYNISGPTLYPSIRFTGRLVTDPANTLRAENTLKGGTGSQLASINTWGYYSTMDVDPVNGCTFWYTTEYLKADGTINWSTWISSFKFPGCV
jgi:hypothetical protein